MVNKTLLKITKNKAIFNIRSAPRQGSAGPLCCLADTTRTGPGEGADLLPVYRSPSAEEQHQWSPEPQYGDLLELPERLSTVLQVKGYEIKKNKLSYLIHAGMSTSMCTHGLPSPMKAWRP